MTIWVSRILEQLLLPPGGMLLLIFAGLLSLKRHSQRALFLLWSGLILLYLLSTPGIARMLVSTLEIYPPLQVSELSSPQAGAIVVLGGGRYRNAEEYGGDTVSRWTLVRLRYTAFLQHRTGLPVLVTGGTPLTEGEPEAHLMAEVLRNEYHIAEVWEEGDSRTTRENARFSAAQLKAKGIHKIYLVTHAWHMPRALDSFTDNDLEVIPAPTGFSGQVLEPSSLLDWLPRANALNVSRLTLHEHIGRLWYAIKD